MILGQKKYIFLLTWVCDETQTFFLRPGEKRVVVSSVTSSYLLVNIVMAENIFLCLLGRRWGKILLCFLKDESVVCVLRRGNSPLALLVHLSTRHHYNCVESQLEFIGSALFVNLVSILHENSYQPYSRRTSPPKTHLSVQWTEPKSYSPLKKTGFDSLQPSNMIFGGCFHGCMEDK